MGTRLAGVRDIAALAPGVSSEQAQPSVSLNALIPPRSRTSFLDDCLSPTERTLVSLVSPCTQPEFLPEAHWATLQTLASQLHLTPRLAFLHSRSNMPGLPVALRDLWMEERRATAAHNLLLAHEEAALLDAFQRAGIIGAIPLKGVSLARILHADAAARFVTDIDFGVRAGDVAHAAGVLRECGYRVSLPDELLRHTDFLAHADEHTAEVTATREHAGFPLLVELHWRILPLAEDVVWEQLHEYSETSPLVRSLSPDLYFLYLCAHVSGHGWAGLRWLCDAGDFLLRFSGRMDANRLLRCVTEANLRHRVGVTLELLDAYFGIRWPALDVLCDARARRASRGYVRRPLQPALALSKGAIHRERMRLQDTGTCKLSYLAWLARPTHTEWLADDGARRSRPAAWLLRARRLARMIFEGGL